MHTSSLMTIVAGAMLFALGCTENPDEVSCKQGDVLSDPSAIIVRMNQMTNEIFELRERKGFLDDRIISKSIAAVTNDAARLQLVDRLSACVLALDVSRLSYQHQYNALRSIEDVMGNVVFGNLPSRYKIGLDAYFERYYDYKLRLMEWRRDQIRRTAPKHRIKNPNVILDEAEDEERLWWREIHYHGIPVYEMHLRMLEGESQLYMRRISKESADRIRAKIENYLGRPLRTLDQLKADGKAKRRVEFTEPDDPHAAP